MRQAIPLREHRRHERLRFAAEVVMATVVLTLAFAGLLGVLLFLFVLLAPAVSLPGLTG